MDLTNYILIAAEDYNETFHVCDKCYGGILVDNPNDPFDTEYTDHNEWFTWKVHDWYGKARAATKERILRQSLQGIDKQ